MAGSKYVPSACQGALPPPPAPPFLANVGSDESAPSIESLLHAEVVRATRRALQRRTSGTSKCWTSEVSLLEASRRLIAGMASSVA